jgi:hypothetical protein
MAEDSARFVEILPEIVLICLTGSGSAVEQPE